MPAKKPIPDIIIKSDFFNKKRERDPEPISQIRQVRQGKPIKGKVIFAILAFVLFLLLSAKVINAFSKAIIYVTLHNEIISVDLVINAAKADPRDLNLETMEVKAEKSKTVVATSFALKETKASGQIIVYNSYSSASQALVSGTRFETSDGKIYRLLSRVTIPGTKTEGEKTVPGSLEVTVTADKTGEEYNIGLSDFAIPGFKGDPRYEKFYARSKTTMSGGFKGETAVMTDSEKAALEDDLKNEIKKELVLKAEAQKPDGYVFYEDATNIIFPLNAENIPDKSNNTFTLKNSGALTAFILPEKDLSDFLVKKYIGENFVGKVSVVNLKDLDFSMINQSLDKNTITFNLKGEARFVWVIQEEELKNALLASPKDLQGVFKTIPAVDKASIIFKPSWWKFFPNESSRIQIEKIVE